MLLLTGDAKLSPFRLEKHLSTLQAREPSVKHLSVQAIYYLSTDERLSDQKRHLISELLDAKPDVKQTKAQQTSFLVIPRMGTVSPWASKALNILQNCHLDDVIRIERGLLYTVTFESDVPNQSIKDNLASLLYDPMTESVFVDTLEPEHLFEQLTPQPLETIPLNEKGKNTLEQKNQAMGLALNETEMAYLQTTFLELGRDPTDVELMMFAQANSEHCRHKIFNANWCIDGTPQEETLFSMIRHTYNHYNEGIITAYSDNAAVLEGAIQNRLLVEPGSNRYQYIKENIDITIKVETHNHPTAISPQPGSATGAGGEIRDEAATGRGAKPKAGFCGFSVSHLLIPNYKHAWEIDCSKPQHVASALDIMLQAPIGAAAFNNEFGRPNLCGYFRSFSHEVENNANTYRVAGYHKPIMLAGGVGNIRREHVKKQAIPVGAKVIVLGGPAMRIGFGGGAASSVGATDTTTKMDFASVQRANPEMQRRAQEVIDHCWSLGDKNPIISIHDVGAGGLSNAIPELLHDSHRGGEIALRAINNDEPGMNPMELWCNESQERYVLAIAESDLQRFEAIAQRERCPFAVVGTASEQQTLRVSDEFFNNHAVDFSLDALFDKIPQKSIEVTTQPKASKASTTLDNVDLEEACQRVLQSPTVADKSFLITIGDRTVGGLTARDQLIGPWQVPVSDCAVTASGFSGYTGESMAVGERAPLALINPEASGRMAVGEAITNIAASRIKRLSQIKLSANWMAAANKEEELSALFHTVKAVAVELCPALNLTIPVGKDSLSMTMQWQEGKQHHEVSAPLSLVISAFAPVTDIRKTLTPQLRLDVGDTFLLLIDLGRGQNRLGGSVLGQVYNTLAGESPDVDDPILLAHFFRLIQSLNEAGLIIAYHDRSDGGLLTSVLEMAFAGHCGVGIQLENLGEIIPSLFAEELGAVIQIKCKDLAEVQNRMRQYDLVEHCHIIGRPRNDDRIQFSLYHDMLLDKSRVEYQRLWSATSYEMRLMRDNPQCAKDEFESQLNPDDPGLHCYCSFDSEADITAPYIHSSKPKVAILREQGVNGQLEMAAAFNLAQFDCYDVHMSDIQTGRVNLNDYHGLVMCGGFSYGDVLGAGRGWASAILHNKKVCDEFTQFFTRENTFTLGVCNGCQTLSFLSGLIPGAEHWPTFYRNQSEQFEARLVMVTVPRSPSILLQGMEDSQIPVVVSHGEGRAVWKNIDSQKAFLASGCTALQYIDNYGEVTEKYPANPNGSLQGITGITSLDGRVTLMMPHPERVIRPEQFSYYPRNGKATSPWLRMFRNARVWLD